MSDVQASAAPARLALRQHARQLLRQPDDVSAHWGRINAALQLPGSEPVQGALADLFLSFDAEGESLKRSALESVRTRLAAHVVRSFSAQAGGLPLSRITSLATRWSVLARPSADISTRARRVSVDDSRLLAQRFVGDSAGGNLEAEQEFLLHCVTCQDKLAFMLARRALLTAGRELSPDWEVVGQQLQENPA